MKKWKEKKTVKGDYSEQNAAVGTKRKFLSKTHINEVKKYLAEYYEKKYSKISLILAEEEDDFPIEKLFTNLALIPEEEYSSAEKLSKNDKLEEVRESGWSKLHPYAKNVTLEEIFVPQNGISKKKVKKVLLLGEAGVGKSTLCHKLCHSWAKRELQLNDHNDNRPAEIADEYLKEIDLILFIPLRMLNREIQRKSQDLRDKEERLQFLVHFIANTILKKSNWEQNLMEYIREHPQKVLLILDGYDECSKDLREFIQPLIAEEDEDLELKLLVTSRAGAIDKIYKKFDQRFKNLGFTHDQIEFYSNMFFTRHTNHRHDNITNSNGEEEIFITKLKEKQSLYEMAHVPLILQMICQLWEIQKKSAKKILFQENSTLTALYRLIVKELMKWEGTKHKEIAKNKQILQILGRIAENGLSRGELMIPCSDLKENKQDLIKTGLVKVAGMGISSYYYFQHLSIQEYLISKKYVPESNSPFSIVGMNKEIINFVKEKKDERNYRLVIQFLAGELYFFCKREHQNDYWSYLDLFFDSLCENLLHCSVRDAEKRIKLILKCINECPPINETWNYKVNSFKRILEDHNEILLEFRFWIVKEGMLNAMFWLIIHNNPKTLCNQSWRREKEDLFVTAVGTGNVEMVKLIFSKYPKCVENRNYQLIHSAIRSGNVSMLNWLQEIDILYKSFLTATPLQVAIETGKIEMIKRVDELYPLLFHQTSMYGENCMFYALKAKKLSIVEWVFQKEQEQTSGLFDKKNFKGESVLHYASYCKIHDKWDWQTNFLPILNWIYDKVEYLISSIDNDTNTVAHTAASQCNLLMLRWINEKSPTLISAKNQYGRTILHHTAKTFHRNQVEVLNWAHCNFPLLTEQLDKEANTIMHFACRTSSIEILEWIQAQNLLEPMNMENSHGEYPLDCARKANSEEILCWFFEHFPFGEFNMETDCEKLLPCFWSDKLEIREKWLKLPGLIRGNTLITFICTMLNNVNKKTLEILLKRKIKDKKLLFHFAMPYSDLSLLKNLFKILPNSSSLILSTDGEDQTVWHYACESLSENFYYLKVVLNWLWDLGDKVRNLLEQKDKNGRTPLHIAAGLRNIEVIKWLVNHNNELLRIFDSEGRNVLQTIRPLSRNWYYLWDFHKEYLPFVEQMYEKDKMMITHPDKDGYVFLHYCVYLRDELTLKWLLNNSKNYLNLLTPEQRFSYCAPSNSIFKELFEGFHLYEIELEWWNKNKTKGILEVLNKADARLFSQIDQKGNTVLHLAVMKGDIDVVKYLVKTKADLIHRLNDDSLYSFHFAVNYPQIMELFLAIDSSEERILSQLNSNQLVHLAKSAVKKLRFLLVAKIHNFDNSLICWRDEETQMNFIHLIFDRGAFLIDILKWIQKDKSLINQVDKNGNTVLHYAAKHCDLKHMKWIYEQNASLLNSVNNEGLSILHSVFGCNNSLVNMQLEVIKWVCGIKEELLFQPDKRGRIPLHLVVRLSSKNKCERVVVEWMMERSSKDLLEIKDHQNRNVLHYAAMGNDQSLLNFLRTKKNEFFTEVDDNGDTTQYIFEKQQKYKEWKEESLFVIDYKRNNQFYFKEKLRNLSPNMMKEMNEKERAEKPEKYQVQLFLEKILKKIEIPDHIKNFADECTYKIEKEVNIQLLVKEFKVSGSYSRGTAIHPFNDIDLFVVLDGTLKPEYKDHPRDFLKIINNSLEKFNLPIIITEEEPRGRIKKARIQNRSVGFQYNKIQFDIVPVFPINDKEGFYWIAGVGEKDWVETSPFFHSKTLEDLNNDTRG